MTIPKISKTVIFAIIFRIIGGTEPVFVILGHIADIHFTLSICLVTERSVFNCVLLR